MDYGGNAEKNGKEEEIGAKRGNTQSCSGSNNVSPSTCLDPELVPIWISLIFLNDSDSWAET